jgi:hypothetical protein
LKLLCGQLTCIMRVLLLHPEDSPRRGPWSRQRWDLVVDLGKSSRFSEQQWEAQYQCPILRADVFREGTADVRRVREILAGGQGQLIDEEGIDWWDLNLRFVPEALAVLTLRRVAAELSPQAELWATRAAWQMGVLRFLCKKSIQTFGSGRFRRSAARAGHYSGILRRFSSAQIKEIFLDKYDSGYRWRSRLASKPQPCPQPVVLLPSAYVNVSRMAAAYAALIPEQPFLLVAARHSGRQFDPPENVQVRDLASYATSDFPEREAQSLLARWTKLQAELQLIPELQHLAQAGILESFPGWLRDGLGCRNAWREVLEREPVSAVVCGDDSNMTTRLPVVLATRRGIPTADFHHGAFDGRYLLKHLASDIYLTKSEMEREYLSRVCGLPQERLIMAAPKSASAAVTTELRTRAGTAAIFFSEPYELTEARTEEVYREVVPALARLAQEHGRSVIVKLHPFESRSQRAAIVRDILSADLAKAVTLVDGPITSELMSKAWFGIAVESSAALDCLEHGVTCFLCAWLAHSPYGYLEQYARFGVGEILNDVCQFAEIPARLDRLKPASQAVGLARATDPAELQRWLTSKSHDLRGARTAS